MSDFDNLTNKELSHIAEQAFHLGLAHGEKLSKPWTADQVWRFLELQTYRYRRIHKSKIRQAYGAGFDIADAMARVHAAQESA